MNGKQNIKFSSRRGKGQSLLCHSENPEILHQISPSPLNLVDFKLYLITDRKLFADSELMFAAVEEALKAGVRAVQLREKDLPTSVLLDMAYRMKELTAKYSAKLFVNDRADVAMCVNADGVHLGQASIPVYAARKVVGYNMMIGVSTHNLDEASIAEKEGADFITLGPVYHTPSKLKYGEPVGTEELKKVSKKISIPVFAIGGIKFDNARDVINAGADGIAVISGILGDNDIKLAVEKYFKILGT